MTEPKQNFLDTVRYISIMPIWLAIYLLVPLAIQTWFGPFSSYFMRLIMPCTITAITEYFAMYILAPGCEKPIAIYCGVFTFIWAAITIYLLPHLA